MPSRPFTLLRPVPLPSVRSANPQTRFSGMAEGPFANIVYGGAAVALSIANCWLDFFPLKLGSKSYVIAGVTRDGSGAALGNCVVKLFTTVDDIERYATVSDASGNFSFSVPSNGWAFYAVAYLAGAPDRAGTTVNTLAGA